MTRQKAPPRTGKRIASLILEPTLRWDHEDFNACVRDWYGLSFDFRQATQHPPNTGIEYLVDGRILKLSLPLATAAERFRRGERIRNVEVILNVMAEDGRIPWGNYRITTGPERRLIEHPVAKWSGRNARMKVAVSYIPPGVE